MKTLRAFLPALLLLIALAACASQPANQPLAIPTAPEATQAVPTAQPTVVDQATPAPPALTPKILKNLAYHFDAVAEALPETGGEVTLKDGEWKQNFPGSASSVAVIYLDSAEGDLNGDGIADAAVLVTINTGGTGWFVQLAAMMNEAGEPVQKATYFLGDRVWIKSVSILDGMIKINMLTHGAQDPLCCPSVEALAAYRLQGGELVEVK